MIDRNDLWKVGMVIVAIAGAITSHTLQLPPRWVPYAGDIEFFCGLIGLLAAILIKPNGGVK